MQQTDVSGGLHPDETSDTHTCKYCGNMHRRGRELCPAFGKKSCHCGTVNHFAKVCMRRNQNTRQLNTADAVAQDDVDRTNT